MVQSIMSVLKKKSPPRSPPSTEPVFTGSRSVAAVSLVQAQSGPLGPGTVTCGHCCETEIGVLSRLPGNTAAQQRPPPHSPPRDHHIAHIAASRPNFKNDKYKKQYQKRKKTQFNEGETTIH